METVIANKFLLIQNPPVYTTNFYYVNTWIRIRSNWWWLTLHLGCNLYLTESFVERFQKFVGWDMLWLSNSFQPSEHFKYKFKDRYYEHLSKMKLDFKHPTQSLYFTLSIPRTEPIQDSLTPHFSKRPQELSEFEKSIKDFWE